MKLVFLFLVLSLFVQAQIHVGTVQQPSRLCDGQLFLEEAHWPQAGDLQNSRISFSFQAQQVKTGLQHFAGWLVAGLPLLLVSVVESVSIAKAQNRFNYYTSFPLVRSP